MAKPPSPAHPSASNAEPRVDPGGEEDFDLLMRRHDMEVLPEAREVAQRVFNDLTNATRLVRQTRPADGPVAYIFSPEALLRESS